MRPGVIWTSDTARARVWAPRVEQLGIRLLDGDRSVMLERSDDGWFEGDFGDVEPGDRYFFVLDGEVDRPDPASLSQPEGVHGPSEVIDLDFDWTDSDWRNPPLRDHVIYELHVGTFTDAGTFDGVIEAIPKLVDLGITAIELMPVAQFPGRRNWGYDGVNLYAVQHSYGGPAGLARLVDACHRAGLAVFVDVVYNHLGPEGNYLREFGPYFTDRYRTPWGEAVNLDGPGSDHVREFFVHNALMWTDQFHVDGLRLDAVHAMYDQSASPFLAELADAVHAMAGAQDRRVHLIAESSANDPRLVRGRDAGGYQLDAAWNDDFHHALHVALTGESARYYADFGDPVADLTTAISDGYIVAGRYSAYRGRRHGAPSTELPRSALVTFAQNHDQIGNRAQGERLSTLVPPERARFAAGVTLLSPWVPMLFMGEEWAEHRPFLYFIDHGDSDLSQAVSAGRAREFEGFITPGEAVPDPAALETFEASRLDWTSRQHAAHRQMLDLYRTLIDIRARHRVITDPEPAAHHVSRIGSVITLVSGEGDERVTASFNASGTGAEAEMTAGRWRRLLDGSDTGFGGEGTATPEHFDGGRLHLGPWCFVAYAEHAP